MPEKTLGELLKERRSALGGLSQEQFAHHVGLSSKSIHNFECGHATPRSLKTIRALADGLGIAETTLVRLLSRAA